MLGKIVSARVITPAGRYDRESDIFCALAFGRIEGGDANGEYAFYIGSDGDNAQYSFEGRIIALIEPMEKSKCRNIGKIWIVAKEGERYINIDIISALDMENELKGYEVTKCMYETSAGAIVYRKTDRVRFLLVKNRNANWGFPKGHIEMGETKYDAARREVLEETGIHVNIHFGFEGISSYQIRDRIDKKVSIFVGTTDDEQTVIQESEIAACEWLPFHTALQRLRFDNDVKILIEAEKFLISQGYIENEYPSEPASPEKFYRGHEAEGIEIHSINNT